MGASPSAAFHDFSSEEKAQISRVLQSKYLALKDKQSSDPNDTQLFEALKSAYESTAADILVKHTDIPKDKLDDTVKQRKPFQTPETEEESPDALSSTLKSVDPMEELPSNERSITVDRTASAATEDDDYEFSLRHSFTVAAPTTISKIEKKNNLLKAKTSSQLLELVSNEVLEDHGKIDLFISQLKAGEVQTKQLTEFRQRRLTYSQQTVEEEPPSPTARAPRTPKTRTTIFASSEIGVVQEKKPPFPPTILGTYSCHGIEPGIDDETIHEKINQDRGCVVYPYNSKKNEALFMVLDGHGEHGDKVSEFVMRQIVVSLEKDPLLLINPVQSLKNAYITTNTALMVTDIHYMTSGCTCVTVYLKENTLHVANAGDSRAVMAREDGAGNFVACNLSRDHKPDDPDEQSRIEASGGYVCPPYEEGLSARVYLDPHFTMIGLAMSRSIGDHAVKNVGVTAEPEVKIFEVDQHDKFMIMGSDGVWEFISSQEAVDIVKSCLDEGYGVPEACQELIETAAARWQEEEGDYRDDITAIVVRFPLPNFAESTVTTETNEAT